MPMTRSLPSSATCWVVVLLLTFLASLSTVAWAQSSSQAVEEWDQLLAEYEGERRAKLLSERQRPPSQPTSPPLDRAAWTRRFLRFAESHPETALERKALRWCLVEGLPGAVPAVYEKLEATFENDPSAADLSEILGRLGTVEARRVLTRWSKSSRLNSVRAHAGFALVRNHRRRLDEAVRSEWDPMLAPSKISADDFQRLDREVTSWFEQARVSFRDVPTWNGTLGPALDQEHHFHQHLAPGRAAPVTKGKDSSDQPIALEELRGRVVLLEFYGHW